MPRFLLEQIAGDGTACRSFKTRWRPAGVGAARSVVPAAPGRAGDVLAGQFLRLLCVTCDDRLQDILMLVPDSPRSFVASAPRPIRRRRCGQCGWVVS